MRSDKNRERAIDAILLMLARYYQTEIPGEAVLAIYHRALEGFSVEQISAAATQHVRESKWFPKASELIERMAPNLEDAAARQAAAVIDAARRIGSRYQPRFDDPITKHLLTGRFSYRSVCDMAEDEVKWFMRDFSAAYLEIAKRGGPASAGALPEGVKEICNRMFRVEAR